MTSNNDRFLELADEFEVQFPDDLSCKIFLGDLCASTLPSCTKCGVACYQRAEDPNYFRCQLCLRKVRVFAQTTFHGIRKFKPWLAALWISLRQAIFSAAELARRFCVAPATAANVRRKISIKFADLMTPIIEQYSGVFVDIFGRRSTETPAREHPRAEQFEVDKIIEIFEASNLPLRQDFINDLKSLADLEENEVPDQNGTEFNGEIESFGDETKHDNAIHFDDTLKKGLADLQKQESKDHLAQKDELLDSDQKSYHDFISDDCNNAAYLNAEHNEIEEQTLAMDFTPCDKNDFEKDGAKEFEKSNGLHNIDPHDSTDDNELAISHTQLSILRQLILQTLSIGAYTNVESLLNATRIDLSELLFLLGMLEFEGLIESSPGLLYRKCKKTPVNNLAHLPTAISDDFKITVKKVWKRISRKYLQPYLGHYWIVHQTNVSAEEILKSFACRDGTGSQLSSKYISPHYVNVPTLH